MFSSKNVFGAGKCIETDGVLSLNSAGLTYIQGDLEKTADFDFCQGPDGVHLYENYCDSNGNIKYYQNLCACYLTGVVGSACLTGYYPNDNRVNLSIKTVPSNADIILDKVWGFGIISPVNFTVMNGSHLLMVSKEGYYNYTGIIKTNPTSETETYVTITLTPIPKSSGGSPFIFKKQIATESSGDIMRSPASSNRFVAIAVGVVGILVASGLVYFGLTKKKQ